MAVRHAPPTLVILLACACACACTPAPPKPVPSEASFDATASAPRAPANADASSDATTDAATASAGLPDTKPPDGKATLHTYRRVLHIGDSMVGFKFGLTRALGARFEADGAKFFSIPVTSAGIQSFEKNADLDDAIKKTRPDLVLITLGANNATSPAPEYLIPAIRKVVKKVGLSSTSRRRCYWIGPPLWKPDTVGFVAVLAKSTEPCTFFDSSKLVLDRMTDGIHPTNKGGETWADAVYQFLIERMGSEPAPPDEPSHTPPAH